MANTYELIASAEATSGAVTNFEFTSIPATYTDLQVLLCARSATTSGNWDGVYIAFNGTSTTTNHSAKRLYGYGSGTASDGSLPYASFIPSSNAYGFGNGSIYIPNYASSNYKSVSVDAVTENLATAALAMLTAGLWSNTAAITSIKLTTESGSNFVQYSTAYLYGIKNS